MATLLEEIQAASGNSYFSNDADPFDSLVGDGQPGVEGAPGKAFSLQERKHVLHQVRNAM